MSKLEELIGKKSDENEAVNAKAAAEAVTEEAAPADGLTKDQPETSEVAPARVKRYQKFFNKVKITGSVAKVARKTNITAVTVCTRATMTVCNYPTIVFFGPNAEKAAAFNEGDRVKITAILQTYDKSQLKPWQSDILVVGSSIDANVPVDNEPSEEGFVALEKTVQPDLNEFEVRGQVTEIKCKRRNEISITIRTFRNGYESIVEYPYMARDPEKFLKSINVHDYIRAIGTIQTANIPVEPQAEESNEATVDSTLKSRLQHRNHVKTHKKQFYVIYDVFKVRAK